MTGPQLEIVDGAEAGEWIGEGLSGRSGSVTNTVPDRFDAYVRVLHPAYRDDDAVTWAEVADELGRAIHPLAQWDAIVGASRYRDEEPDWPGAAPETGSLEPEKLAALAEILAGHSAAERWFFAIWTGSTWGHVSPGEIEMHSTDDLSSAFPDEQARRAPLKVPGREYAVLVGPPAAATEIEDRLSGNSPQLIWPEDRAWCVGTGIDFDSTLVGGTEGLARAILDDPRLEAFPIGPHDLLTWDADKVNPPLRD